MSNHSNVCICQIEKMIDYAWRQAIKYKFDPVAGRIHEEYLGMIKKIKEENENYSLKN